MPETNASLPAAMTNFKEIPYDEMVVDKKTKGDNNYMPKTNSSQPAPLKNFLEIPYDELEALNLEAAEAAEKLSPAELEKKYRAYMQNEKRLKAGLIYPFSRANQAYLRQLARTGSNSFSVRFGVR